MTAAIRYHKISKRFGRIKALDSVTFEVPEHSIFGLLGPNGAGKTTLLSITTNFLKAHAGSVEVLGINVCAISRLQGRLSVFPQDAQFQRNMPILDQLIFFRLLDGRSRSQARSDVLNTLEMVGLGSMAKRRVGTLSHGMIKRLGIAQAFLGQPEVILLDEPTAGLDPANARQIRDLIKKLQFQATIMISSHNLAEIQELCDHIAILDNGRLIKSDSVDALTRSGREFYITLSRPLQDEQHNRLLSLAGIRSFKPIPSPPSLTKESFEYLVLLDLSQADQNAVINALLHALLDMQITPCKFTPGRSLETHFLEITGGANNK